MTFSETALHILRTVAPTLADAALGPFGPLAAAAIHAALGTDPADPKAAETALLAATPDQLLALKKADQDFEIQIEKLGIEKAKLSFDDTAGARAMQMAVKDPTVARLAWLVIGGFLLISMVELAAMLVWPDKINSLPQGAWMLIGTVLGYLANESKQAGAFYFGSSAGSQAKDRTISDLAKSP